MTLWILDTDHVSLFQTGHPLVTQRVQSTDPTAIAITIITVEEQMYGRLNRIRRAKSTDELRLAYFNLNHTLTYFKVLVSSILIPVQQIVTNQLSARKSELVLKI
jgi:tRNA(fMet)-specific endonuclease VapC